MNNDVQQEIIILNVMRYENEKGKGSRVSFILSDQKQETKNFNGYPVVDQFYKDDTSILNKITDEFIFEPVVATFKSQTNTRNPLRTSSILSRIESDNNAVDLL